MIKHKIFLKKKKMLFYLDQQSIWKSEKTVGSIKIEYASYEAIQQN